jgi:Ca2+-binding RTX toxin-like protein
MAISQTSDPAIGFSEAILQTESDRNDTILGHGGADAINAKPFALDTDRVHGNKGDDEISVADGDGLDKVQGGQGQDRCFGDPGDDLDCEEENPLTGTL